MHKKPRASSSVRDLAHESDAAIFNDLELRRDKISPVRAVTSSSPATDDCLDLEIRFPVHGKSRQDDPWRCINSYEPGVCDPGHRIMPSSDWHTPVSYDYKSVVLFLAI